MESSKLEWQNQGLNKNLKEGVGVDDGRDQTVNVIKETVVVDDSSSGFILF